MAIVLDNVDEERVKALNNVLDQNKLVTRGYNEIFKHRLFDKGNVV